MDDFRERLTAYQTAMSLARNMLRQGIISEDALTEMQLSVLSELPDGFTTAEGVAIAGKCGMSERSFKRFLRDRKGVLFIRNTHGNYTKL